MTYFLYTANFLVSYGPRMRGLKSGGHFLVTIEVKFNAPFSKILRFLKFHTITANEKQDKKLDLDAQGDKKERLPGNKEFLTTREPFFFCHPVI